MGRIEVTTNIKTKNEEEIMKNKNENDKGMKKLNYNSDDVEWDKIRNELKEIQWNEIFKDKDTETCLNILLEIIIKLCKKYIPEKKSRNKNTIPKRRRQLFQKMKLLRRSKRNANNKRKKVIDNKILEVEIFRGAIIKKKNGKIWEKFP